jgi:predicted dehydrogenase
MTHRVGLVGLRQAKSFIPMFNALPDTEVTALCDIDEEFLNKTGEEAGIQELFTDYDEFLKSDISIVSLSTPIQVHGQQSIRAMRAGKHALCQYIAASDEDQADELIGVARESGRKYMMIETDCYERKNLIMKALAAKGAYGELTFGRGHYIHDCKDLSHHPDGSLTWRGEQWMIGQGGSVNGVHTCVPLLQTFGERVEEVYSYGPGPRTFPKFNWSDRVTSAAKLPSGRILELVTDVLSWHPVICGYYVQGTNGFFEFNRGAFVEEEKLSSEKDLDQLVDEFGLEGLLQDRGGHSSSWEAIIHEFIQAIDEDRHPSEDLEIALHITAIGWAADESLQSGQPAKVKSFDLTGINT